MLTEFYNPEAAYLISRRERQVLFLDAQGYSQKEIATQLEIAEQTVKTHIDHALVKTGFENTLQMVLALLDKGIFQPEQLIPDIATKIGLLNTLSAREKKVGEYITGLGDTRSPTIGEELAISDSHVRKHIMHASQKLGVSGKMQVGIVLFEAYRQQGIQGFIPGLRRYPTITADFSI